MGTRYPKSKKTKQTRKPHGQYQVAETNRRESDASMESQKGSLNDVGWYSRNPLLLNAAASVPYPYRPGMSVPLTLTDGTRSDMTIPGVACMEWVPAIGVTQDATDPANQAAFEIYAKVREAYSGSLAADAPDYIIYLMGLDSIFSFIAQYKRILRTINTYSSQNYAMPNVLLKSYGLSDTDQLAWRKDYSNAVGYINELIGMTKKFKCPAIMDIFNRHYWMNDNVYLDAPSPMAQMYVFNQIKYFKFTVKPYGINTATPAGGLQLNSPDWTTPFNAYVFCKGLIDALSSDDSNLTISGYLSRAFGDVPSFGVEEFNASERLEAVYSEEVLSQIENSFSIPLGFKLPDSDVAPNQLGNFDIGQIPEKNLIKYEPKVYSSSDLVNYWYNNKIELLNRLSVRTDDPTVVDTVIATRLLCTCSDFAKRGSASTTVNATLHCGTEVPASWKIYVGSKASDDVNVYSIPGILVQDNRTESTLGKVDVSLVNIMTQFDWFPIVYLITIADNDVSVSLIGDVHNVTSISQAQLDKIHRVCILSEFNAFGIL